MSRYSSRLFRLAAGGVVSLETADSRRRILPWCREVLAAGVHGPPSLYSGSRIMRGNATSIAAMSIARDQHGVAGWAWVTTHGLTGVWVEERCRRRGLGRALATPVLGLLQGPPPYAIASTPDGVGFYAALGVRNRDTAA